MLLAAVRRAKTEAKVSQRAEVSHLFITAPLTTIALLELNATDLRNAGAIQEMKFSGSTSDAITSQVILAVPLA